MDQKEIVRKFVESLGKINPPKINTDLVSNYLSNIVVDSESLEEFLSYADQFLKHSQTFQMAFLLHSLSSVLMFHPLGSAVAQVKGSLAVNNVFDIPDGAKLMKLDGAKRYDELCQKLMDFESREAKSLEKRIKEVRKGEKIDDGSEPNRCFDPMTSNFRTQTQPGEDLTEDLEVRD
jgi:hypothetical protein